MKNLINGLVFFPKKILTLAVLATLVAMPASTAARPDVPPGKATSTPTYDYRDFTAPAVSQRVFDESIGGNHFEVIEDREFTAEPGEALLTRKWLFSGILQKQSNLLFLLTDTDLLWRSVENLDGGGNWVGTDTFDPPLSIRQSVMPKGALQSYGAVKLTIPSYIEYGTTRSNVALGLEDVEVPYGVFSDCLRTYEEHNGTSRVSWYCPDVGLTKRFWGSSGRIWELSGCIGCPSM